MATTKYLCAKDVAKLLGVSVRTAQRLMKSNEIPSFRVGQSPRTDERSVSDYVARRYAEYRLKLAA